MEYKEFLKKNLLNNVYGTYSRILDIYREQMELNKTPSFFRQWLAEELKVPIEAINLSSLNSALQQQRKKNKQAKKLPVTTKPQAAQSPNKTGGFPFSTPSSDDKKEPRIKEY